METWTTPGLGVVMARVYVSSTVADLKQERRAVMDWLVAAGHQPVHSYVPDSDTVQDSCLDDVNGCDLYVLIAGHRYGFQPAGDNTEGLSITHLEFRRAVECGIPRVALLRTSIPDVSLSDLADPRRLALVSAFREEVAREVRPAEFGDLRGLIQGLSTGVQSELNKREEQQTLSGQPVRLAPRPPLLAGREALLTHLDTLLSGGGVSPPSAVALCGLGGAGKTSVAVEYAHRHLAELGVAWQFAAQDATVLAAGFSELAAQLGAWGLADARDPVASVHAVLAGFARPWLLIFDNAADMASVAEYLPPAGFGRVLITSQNPHWSCKVLDVPALDQEVAANFLVKRTSDPDRDAARELAGELGGLPLALEQAAAYMHAIEGNLADYLALFRQRRAEMLALGEPSGYDKTIANTWALAFDRLQGAAPNAVGLLRLLAFYAPEAIPLGLLLRPHSSLTERFGDKVVSVLLPLLDDQLAANDAIGALRRYSLVTPAADRSVSVHRLVQAVTTDQMPPQLIREWQQAAADVIEAAIPADPRQPAAWRDYAALLPHAQAALANDSVGMSLIAAYLGWSGKYTAARDLQDRICDARKRLLGPEHPETLHARYELARWTGLAGYPVAARDQFDTLLPIYERVHGPEHRATLNTLGNLAHWKGQAGNATAARDQLGEVLPIAEQVCGSEELDVLTLRGHLATWTGEAGDASAARNQLAALLPVRERVSGAEHPDTLQVRGDRAYWTGRAGQSATARDQFAALLPVRERVSGAEHPDTLQVRGHLAYWTGRAGDAAAARDQFTALLPERERVSGALHPETLQVRGYLASWTGRAGAARAAAAARDHFEVLLLVAAGVGGPEHPSVLAVRTYLATWTGEAGDPAAARDQFAQLLPTYERAFGLEHPNTLQAQHRLAHWTGEAGDPSAARDQFAELLPVRERVSGPRHPDALHTRGHLAYWTGQAGDAAAARDQFADLLPVGEEVGGPEHPDVLTVRTYLASWTGEAGDPAAARDQFARLLPVRKHVCGAEHPDTLQARQFLARWTGEAGDPTAAKNQYAALLPIYERVLGSEHPATLAVHHNLAHWTGKTGEPATARDQLATLLPIRKRVLGSEHPVTLSTRAAFDSWAKAAGEAT